MDAHGKFFEHNTGTRLLTVTLHMQMAASQLPCMLVTTLIQQLIQNHFDNLVCKCKHDQIQVSSQHT